MDGRLQGKYINALILSTCAPNLLTAHLVWNKDAEYSAKCKVLLVKIFFVNKDTAAIFAHKFQVQNEVRLGKKDLTNIQRHPYKACSAL